MNWKYKINIAPILEMGSSLEDYDVVPKNIRMAMANELSKLPEHIKTKPEINDLLYSMDFDDLTVHNFNYLLDDFFDCCDRNNIWAGAI